jgi:predicted nucleic acid-binding protein
MRLIVDASVLVGELFPTSGRARLGDERLDLFLPEQVWGEVRHELPRRLAALARHRSLDDLDVEKLSALCLTTVESNVAIVDRAILAPLEEEARSRVPCDENDWPLVACALVLAADIWTADKDLFGTGVATWTTESLVRWLERHPPG